MKVIIGILSALSYNKRRQDCINTWYSELKKYNIEAYFLIGNNSNNYIIDKNILYLPCKDDYNHLPSKTFHFCKWALENREFDYLFKCDDDTFVQVDRFAQYKTDKDYIGIDPIGNGELNSGGAGYFLSKKSVKLIVDGFKHEIGLEDLLIAQFLKQNNIERTEDHRFQACHLDRTEPSQNNDIITCHYIRDNDMYKLYNRFKEEK